MGKAMTMYKRTKLRAILAIASLLLSTACSKEANQNSPVTTTTNTGTTNAPASTEVKQRGNALVRVIDAVPGGPAVEVFADDSKIFSGIAYKTASPYKEVSGERHTFRIRPAGQDTAQPLAENSEGLSDGKHYTVVATASSDGKPTLYVYNDDLVPPPAGKARVRVLNASPEAGEVDVYAKQGNKKLFGGVNALTISSYSEFDPMTGAIEVRPAGKNNAVLTLPNARFEAGNNYTVAIFGKTSGTPKLESMIIEDRVTGVPVGMPAANTNMNPNANMRGNVNSNTNPRR
jgi:hypothetical protein